MDKIQDKKKFQDITFYFLMGILGISILYVIGYLIYDMLFG
ncbi:hypothetical protein [Rosettibacter firmus]